MCGIFGIVDSERHPINKELMKQSLSSIAHRGPDDEGIYINNQGAGGRGQIGERHPSVGLGHRRLSIIDLSSAGHQPMSNEDESIRIVSNGEIYNYKSLRNDLKKKGHIFKSDTDTEVIIHLYEDYGEDCVSYLRGMFAFAIWDGRKNQLMIAKDRFGQKPLFYSENNGKFVFSSEIKPLLIYQDSLALNQRGLQQYFSFFFIPAPETAFEGIKKLLPAHILVHKNGVSKLKRYWNLDYFQKTTISFQEALEKVRELVIEAIKIRMVSDVPLGAFISGGLDSSIVVGVMSSISSSPIKTFSMAFEYEELNEAPYSSLVANYFQTEHNEFTLSPDTIQYLPSLINLLGEPHADSSILPTYILAKNAKSDITVTLVGEGADELFAGYRRFLYYKIFNCFDNFPSFFKKKFNILLTDRYKKWLSVFSDDIKDKIFKKDYLEQKGVGQPDEELMKIIYDSKKFDGIDSALSIDSQFFLPYDLLVKLDVSTMAHALEARAPFLDHKLVEFVNSLPPKWKLNGITFKHILKEAFKGLLPKKIINRKKTGFVVPVNYWFRSELKDYVRDILLSSKAKNRGYFSAKGIEWLLKEHEMDKGNYGHQIWALLVCELWHSIFIDGSSKYYTKNYSDGNE